MNKCRILKELSSYLDNQLSEKRKIEVEKHLTACPDCTKELARLKFLSQKIKTWQAPMLSPDFDASLRNKIVREELERGEVKMNKKTLRILIPSGVLAGILVLVSFGAMQVYMQRGISGKIKESSSEIGEQYQVGSSTSRYTTVSKNGITISEKAYEPYYASSKPEALVVLGNSALSFGGGTTRQLSKDSLMRAGAVSSSFMDNEAVWQPTQEDFNTEGYDRIYDNDFLKVIDNPLSTFSIDVDTAAYSNVRRFLDNNQLPPKDAVRIEEMINYFSYEYPQPKEQEPFSVTTEVGVCPWNTGHKLALVGLQGKKIETENLPASNLVFLLDVSGSMDEPNKLPLLQSAFRLLVNNLRPQDKVSIVVYAGAAGVVLDAANGGQKAEILSAIDRLRAGGSTAGGQGIVLAYDTAKKNLIKDGNNRVILATDGDFNIGITNDGDLTRLIEEKRNDGIFLTVLGFGMGNYKDNKMEKLADKGNGNLAYIDNLLEAKKVFVTQLSGTLLTIAKDVKIQAEFNPAKVKAYRLIGYENRMLKKEDFNNDKKDAGEIGAGHSVTALYEIVPAESQEDFSNVDALQYQKTTLAPSDDLFTVKLRYKEPNEDVSKLITHKVPAGELKAELSENLKFASSVAEFGLLLRNSEYKANASYEAVLGRAKASKGQDLDGYRAEFIKLAEIAQLLDNKTTNK